MISYSIVIPTIGRPCLTALLEALSAGTGPLPEQIVLVDDRKQRTSAIDLSVMTPELQAVTRIIVTRGRGPAAARNAGWRCCRSEWIAFLDDDVIPPSTWRDDLVADLSNLGGNVAASQGSIRVPLPSDRPASDWERNVAGLEDAQWATADMAYRRSVLQALKGFDERFGRAYREDADLGFRTLQAGHEIVKGQRYITHPVRPASRWVSQGLQKGNADDVLMRKLHGPQWRDLVGAGHGRSPWHLATVASGLAFVATRKRVFAAGWLGLYLDFFRRRIAPGPKTIEELSTMAVTSATIPFVAVWQRIKGELRWRKSGDPTPVKAVLFDRDGTLIDDVPYNGDPELVRPVPGAKEAIARLRRHGLSVGVITNQSGVGRGLISDGDVAAVNQRVNELVGPIRAFAICNHQIEDQCSCRKPSPALVHEAAAKLGVRPEECVVIGDIGSDVDAALAAGARAILVPNEFTLPDEVLNAPLVRSNIGEAVDHVIASAS